MMNIFSSMHSVTNIEGCDLKDRSKETAKETIIALRGAFKTTSMSICLLLRHYLKKVKI